jgi:hypothetical protein
MLHIHRNDFKLIQLPVCIKIMKQPAVCSHSETSDKGSETHGLPFISNSPLTHLIAITERGLGVSFIKHLTYDFFNC